MKSISFKPLTFAGLLIFQQLAMGSEVRLKLEWSEDLNSWVSVPVTPEMLTEGGEILHSSDGDSAFFRLRIEIGEEPPAPEGFSLIPAGTFTMGSPEDEPGRVNGEGPQNVVTLTRSFYLQRTQVTWAQWNEVLDWAMGSGLGYDMALGRKGSHGDSRNTDEDPVTMVSWQDVVKWLNAKSERDGLAPAYRVDGQIYRAGEHDNVVCDFDVSGYRLPTEAEWEYAARAGTTTAFYSGPIMHTGSDPVDPNLDLIGWYDGNSDTGSGLQSHPVGQKQPNAFGLYDMSGNVMEWCWDWWLRIYTSSAVTDPTGPASGTLRVARGGSWYRYAGHCRSAFRSNGIPDLRLSLVGFRPAHSD